MLPDLERLIRLQSLHHTADDARQRIANIPAQLDALDAKLHEHRASVDQAKHRLDDNQTARRTVEGDLAGVQSRLSKFKDQLMAVKTNREYQAVQKEIAGAEGKVQSFEERILESMLESDELGAHVADTERALTATEAEVSAERQSIEQDRARFEVDAHRAFDAHTVLAQEVDAAALALFEKIAKHRKGVAVVEARDGLCSSCHVRLRPQVFNEIRRNDNLIQCESCSRILHFVEPLGGTATVDQS